MSEDVEFMLMDGRAVFDLSRASVLYCCCNTEDEAQREGEENWAGYDAIWVEIRGDEQKLRYDLPPWRNQ